MQIHGYKMQRKELTQKATISPKTMHIWCTLVHTSTHTHTHKDWVNIFQGTNLDGKNIMVCGLACLLGNAALGLHGRDHGRLRLLKCNRASLLCISWGSYALQDYRRGRTAPVTQSCVRVETNHIKARPKFNSVERRSIWKPKEDRSISFGLQNGLQLPYNSLALGREICQHFYGYCLSH